MKIEFQSILYLYNASHVQSTDKLISHNSALTLAVIAPSHGLLATAQLSFLLSCSMFPANFQCVIYLLKMMHA